MKKTISYSILAAVVGFLGATPAPVGAEGFPAGQQQELRPQVTPPSNIALLFYKLSGKTPDFEAWARNTEAYQSAASFEKSAVQEQQVQLLKNNYSLLTFQEPLVVEMPVTLSEYSAANKGFLVGNFREDTFFSARYNDQSYAVVPVGIIDKQFLKVPDAAVAQAIKDAGRSEKGKLLTMLLVLSPKYADNASPATLSGESHWLISAEIKKMMLYSAESDVPLWRSEEVETAPPDEKKRQELLKLRQ